LYRREVVAGPPERDEIRMRMRLRGRAAVGRGPVRLPEPL